MRTKTSLLSLLHPLQCVPIIFAVLLCFSFNNLNAQNQITPVEGMVRTFEYKGELFKYNVMDPIFQQDELANNHFLKARRQINTSKAFGYTSLASLAVGGIALLGNDGCSGFLCFSTEEIIAIYSWVFVFPVTGTIGIALAISGSNKLKKAVEIFNINALSESKPPLLLDIGLIDGRLGVRLSF